MLRPLRHKRGQASGILSQAPAAVVILVVIAVILGVGSTVLDKVGDTQPPILAPVSNEAFTADFNLFVDLSSPGISGSVVVNNITTGAVIDASNYVVQASSGSINVSNATLDGHVLNATYTSSTASAAFNTTQDGLAGLTTFSDFQPTIAVIVVAVIIIALLLAGFGFAVAGRP